MDNDEQRISDEVAENARLKKVIDDHLTKTGIFDKFNLLAKFVESTDAAFKLIQEDPHQWSTRPCQTCKTVSSLIGRPFGCVMEKYKK